MKSKLLFSIILFASFLSRGVSSAPVKLNTHSYSGSEAGFLVNSHLIFGEKEAILIDAQFLQSEAKKLVEAVNAIHRKLTTIYITHAHPDHYFGLSVLQAAFPDAKILARPSVIDEIVKTSKGKQDYWKGVYQDEIPSEIVIPSPFTDKQIQLEGNEIRVVTFQATENGSSTAFYIPSLKTFVSGDLVYNQVHLWLADADGNLGHWRKSLKRIQKDFLIETILPGHGPAEEF